jgi:glycerophosphoryl diester phosphodiesterase
MVSRSSTDLARLDAGSWLSPDFSGTRIPTLAATLAGLRPWGGRIYPEVKAVRSLSDLDPILDLLRRSGFHSRTVLISLDHRLLEEVRARDSEIHLGWVVAHEEDMDWCTRRVADDGRGVLDPAAQLLLGAPARTQEIVGAGIPLATWTVNDIDEARALYDLGVRRFTTNEVARLVEWSQSVEASRADE